MDVHYDVIVVGGGPAGSAAARRAALGGRRVLVLDAARFPRSKPCGGAVSEQGLSYLDCELPREIVHSDVFGARMHFGSTVIEAQRPYRIAVVTTRAELDQFLLGRAAEAGAAVRQGTRVLSVVDDGPRVYVRTTEATYTSRYVIGADGAQSVVAASLRGRLPRAQYGVLYEFNVPSRRTPPSSSSRGFVDIHFGVAYRGYGWVFPRADHWNVGVGALASGAPNVKRAAHDFYASLTSLSRDVDASPEDQVGWIVPAGGYSRTVARGRVLLAGDAAGYVDAFAGEGIAYAILSGQMAGSLIAAACEGGDADAPRRLGEQYSALCRTRIERDLWYSLILSRLLHCWPGGLLRLFSTEPAFVEKYLDVLAGGIRYADYLKWFVPRACARLPRVVLRQLLVPAPTPT